MEIHIQFTSQPIQVPSFRSPSKEIGAVVEFHGIVREMEGETALQGLFYEAYESMARKVLQNHLAQLQEIHRCAHVEFIHRTGWVPVGEASLYIRVASSHRAQALRCLSELIDRLKLDVPIWKSTQPPA